MRLCAALALVLIALVVLTVKTGRRPPRRAAPVGRDDAQLAPARVRASVPSPSSPPAARELRGIAHLRGRVLFPPGVTPTPHVKVVADDSSRAFDALVHDDGRFEFHLPSGRYTLVASMPGLVGVAPDVLARADAAHDVDIELAVGAVIRGTVTGPHATFVTALPTGRDSGQIRADDVLDDGHFSIAGLIPGRRYDITFSGQSVRSLTVTGVAAPAEGLTFALQARPRVRGAIGFPRGTLCPIEMVRLSLAGARESGNDEWMYVDKDCAFALPAPEGGDQLTIVASGKGWHLEQQLAIPPDRDPDPICLNPPCRSDPFEGLPRLVLTFDGPEGPSLYAQVTRLGDSSADRGGYACNGSPSGGECTIDGLDVGATVLIKAWGTDCRSDPRTVTVVPGYNRVRVLCERDRVIEGIVRMPGGDRPEPLVVRCAGADPLPLQSTHLFRLNCSPRADAIEYRFGTEGTWLGIRIASLDNPAVVDIDIAGVP
jgi:hypothetical protein